MKDLLILHDWRKFLAGKYKGDIANHSQGSVDIEQVKEIFEGYGYHVELKEFAGMDFNKSYKGWFVLYASSEERGLFYKEFIEDVLLKLELDGAVLIPQFKYFRAHHNKVFQELLRKQFQNSKLRKPESKILGRFEELRVLNDITYPCVVKTASGAGSSGVCLVNNTKELEHIVYNLNKQLYMDYHFNLKRDIWHSRISESIKNILRSVMKKETVSCEYTRETFSNKLILQEFIPCLDGDYKVLYFYGKYYVLNRKNRPGDFRASGSGFFTFPELTEDVKIVLDFAHEVVEELKVPMISMDIGKKAGVDEIFLIEYQCLNFGPYAIQYSRWHFIETNDSWGQVNELSNLEEEYCRAVNSYINNNFV